MQPHTEDAYNAPEFHPAPQPMEHVVELHAVEISLDAQARIVPTTADEALVNLLSEVDVSLTVRVTGNGQWELTDAWLTGSEPSGCLMGRPEIRFPADLIPVWIRGVMASPSYCEDIHEQLDTSWAYAPWKPAEDEDEWEGEEEYA